MFIFSLVYIQLLEMFGAGTAAIVCPVERIVYEGKSYDLATMNKGMLFRVQLRYSIYLSRRSNHKPIS